MAPSTLSTGSTPVLSPAHVQGMPRRPLRRGRLVARSQPQQAIDDYAATHGRTTTGRMELSSSEPSSTTPASSTCLALLRGRAGRVAVEGQQQGLALLPRHVQHDLSDHAQLAASPRQQGRPAAYLAPTACPTPPCTCPSPAASHSPLARARTGPHARSVAALVASKEDHEMEEARKAATSRQGCWGRPMRYQAGCVTSISTAAPRSSPTTSTTSSWCPSTPSVTSLASARQRGRANSLDVSWVTRVGLIGSWVRLLGSQDRRGRGIAGDWPEGHASNI